MEHNLEFEKPIDEIEKMIGKLSSLAEDKKGHFAEEIIELKKRSEELRRDIFEKLSPWQMVQIARHPNRPVLCDYIRLIFTDFVELHGDRAYGDDRALIGGFAMLGKRKVMLIGTNKGRNVQDNIVRNFGMPRPEGYRKSLRLMRLAEKYNVPVVALIDTPAAYPGVDAEERGQAEAIARNLTEMARLKVPIVCIVTGEGGSGGALAIGVGDVILMLSYAIYSVIPPEGCAAILWRDAAFAPQAAEALKLTARSLTELGIVDEVVPEPLGGAHRDHQATADAVKVALIGHLKKLEGYSENKLLAKRFEKYSNIGVFNK